MARPAWGGDRHLTGLSVLVLSCRGHQSTWQKGREDRFVWGPGFGEMPLSQGRCGDLNENVSQYAHIFDP